MSSKKDKSDLTKFSLDIRIYWEYTDAGGIVYHSNYLNFAERARTEWLRKLGVKNQSSLLDETGVHLVVKSLSIDYTGSARLDDVVSATCEVEKIGPVSLLLKQEIRLKNTANNFGENNDNENDKLLAKLTVKIACVDEKQKLTALPDYLVYKFKK